MIRHKCASGVAEAVARKRSAEVWQIGVAEVARALLSARWLDRRLALAMQCGEKIEFNLLGVDSSIPIHS